MKAIARENCPFCGGRGAMLGSAPLPLPENYCQCVRWIYDEKPATGPIEISCAHCSKPFVAFLGDNGGAEGGGLCGDCFVRGAFIPTGCEATAVPVSPEAAA